ncbi:MAG: phage head morphogenesis protein [Armatimonadota bacterium]
MPVEATSQQQLIRQATEISLHARNRYTEQVINALTDDLASAREQVGKAITRYKSLGSLPDNKLAGLKGLERLDAEIKSIMGELRRSHTIRFRAEAKAAFRLGVYHGIEEFATAQLPVYRDLTPEGLDKLTTKAFQIVDTDALDFLANYTTTLAGDVNRETTDGIMRTIRGAIATGKGVDDIVRDLGEVVKDKESFRHAGSKVFSKAQYRMEVIARTEVLRAHNQGKLKFHQAVGIQRLEWFTMDDERMCAICGALDGKSFPSDQFPPQPAHPQCRCGHYPAWPLVVCGQGLLAASAAPSTGDACILPPQSIEGMAAAQAEEQKALKGAFESGDPGKLGALTLKQIQTLAKQQGVAIARTKADFLKLLADKGVDGSGLSGKSLEAMLKQYGIGALRSKDELVALLAQKQAAFIQAQLQAQLLKEAAQSASGLDAMTAKELQDLAVKKGVSLNMTKADVIALLDQLEPGVDHSGLAGQALIAAKKSYHIGPLKNKSQLITALQQIAGKEMAHQAVQDTQQAVVIAATHALKDAAGKVILPATPGDFAPFLEQLAAAEQALVNSPTVPQDVIQQIATELSTKKLAFQQQVQSLGAADVKKIAQAAKIPKYQWATKDELVTLMTETSPVKLDPVKQSIADKWAKWNAQQQANKAGKVTTKAQQAAQQANAAAAQQAKDLIEGKLDAVWAPGNAEGLEAYVSAMQELSVAIHTHSHLLSPDELALYSGKASVLHGYGTSFLSDLKVSDLKALAKAKKFPNWAFANKEQLVTLLSASDASAKQDVLQALATKVAGYGKGTPSLKTGKALAAELAAPDSPTMQIGTASYAQVDAQWATIAAHPDRHFTFARDARDLGGVHPKQIYHDPDGNEWLFKPLEKASDAFLADADEMTYCVSRLLDPGAIEVRKITLNGQRGTLQRMKTGLQAQKNYDGMDPAAISPEEVAQLLRHHVVDWLLSNHDSHSANFLRLADGSVVAIDRAQAFKFFGRDKLDIGYNPNNLPEHPTTLYNAIFGQVKKKKLTVDPMHTLAAIERVEAIDDAEYLALLRPYAQGRPGDTDAFLQAALARKHALRADYERFYQGVLGDKTFTFDQLVKANAKKTTTVLSKHLEEAVSTVVDKESWQGMVIPFDRDMVEDVQLHLFTERVPGRRGKVDHRTVYRLKLRPDKQQRVLDAIEMVRKGESGLPRPGDPLIDDVYYTRILNGVRTVNAHLERGGKFNPSKLDPALACEAELRALLDSDRIEVRDMAAHYLKTIDELTVYARGGSTALGRVSQLEMFRVQPGRVSVLKTSAPSFRVTEGIAQLDQRACVEGHIELKGTEKRVGQLFKGNLSKTGKQYTLEYDDGTKIRLRPFATDSYDEHYIQPGQNYYAISGDVEIIVPGKGTPEQVEQTFEKLRQLGLPAEVAPPEYQEYLYLHQVAVANNLHTADVGYQQMMRRLEGRNAPIQERVEEMVAYWNTRLKVKDVRKLARYNPAGDYQLDTRERRKGGAVGYRRTSRFDLDVEKDMRGYNLMHQVVGGSSDEYVKMVDQALSHNGSLLSTTEKLRIGVAPGGMSPEADMGSGGANYVFTRWRPDPRGAKSFREMGFYLKPGIAQRTDTIVYATDHYGRCYGSFVDTHRETSPARWKRIAETSRNNETILKQNITLLDNLDCIVLDSQSAKQQMIAMFQQHGVTVLPDGRKIEDIIHVIPGAKKGYSG